MPDDPPSAPGGDTLSCRPEALLLDLLADGLSAEIPVTGTSMAPCIRGHDVLTLAPPGDDPIGRGDVVAFPRPDGRLVVHRVVCEDQGCLLTRGDAAPGNDGWIDRGIVVGRVSRVMRRGRRARFGLGPDRSLVAVLSRAGILAPLLRPFRWLARQRG